MSQHDQDVGLVQLNLGQRSRIAGRDYYESRVPDSIKVYLATTPSDRLDEEAIDNERLFYYRFALDVARPVREQLIAIKRQHGFTDAQCRWLRRSGQLQIRSNNARLKPDRRLFAIGWLYAAMLAWFFSNMLLVIGASTAPSWKQAIGTVTIGTLWAVSIWVIHRLFLAPWRLVMVVGALSAGRPPAPRP